MSAIHGLIRLDGPPVEPAELAAMAQPMAHWGPDGGGRWREGPAAFGQLIAHRTPNALHEDGPVTVAGGTVVVTAAGRLDNRDELRAELRAKPATADGRLIALAYERWGQDAVRHLLGDWAFAAYHPRERRLVLARDHYGQTALYHHHDRGTFAFASSLKGLLALPHVPRRLNELRLAQHLAVWATDGAATMYEGVQRLPPAHVLTFDDGSVRTREYWRPEDAPDVRLGSDAAYVEQFVELFAAAVRTRLPPDADAASTLSSGLDSGAVTALAAREAAVRGRGLTALTAVPAYPEVARARPDMLVDEWPGAALVASAYSNVEHVRVTGRDITPLEANARSHEIHEQLAGAAPNRPWVLALLAEVQRRGLGVLLTGQTGNAGVSWRGEEGVALRRLVAGDAGGAMRALAARRRAGVGWPLAIRRELVGPVRRRLTFEVRRWRYQRALAGRLIAPSLVDRLNLVERMRASGWDPWFARATAEEFRLAILLPGLTPVGGIWHELGAAHGLDVFDPTVDVRLLEFCLGIPPEQFVHGPHDRWLIRRGLEGLVPAEVRWNRRRGEQGADLAFRLSHDAAAVTATLERIDASALVRSCLDMDALWSAWKEVRSDPAAASAAASVHVMAGLDAGVFLLRF